MDRGRLHIAAVIAAVTAMLAVAGCDDAPDAAPTVTSPAPADRIPPAFDVTFRWVPGDVVDPSSPEGTFVRAFVESFELANAGQSVDWGYRGFSEAAPSNIAQMIGIYPPAESTEQPGVGTAFFTGLRRTVDGDLTRIVLCRFGYRSIRGADGRWSSATDAPRPVEIDFRRGGAGPVTGVSGTARTPSDDVFGDWYVTRYDFSAVYPTPTPDEQACTSSIPAEVPVREPVEGKQPWPVMAPSPGWSTTQPV
ncbi:hypothetical protein AAFP30_14095 [Gordonia sp. CPCC 205515]|uniref:hypothetical protein n=1 Tax=Gordonia sp. CPCC 205515 TaxID=3140791 RepID=UPI003AF37FC4